MDQLSKKEIDIEKLEELSAKYIELKSSDYLSYWKDFITLISEMLKISMPLLIASLGITTDPNLININIIRTLLLILNVVLLVFLILSIKENRNIFLERKKYHKFLQTKINLLIQQFELKNNNS